MYSFLSLIFILCLWNSVLFYNQSFGINVILFTLPLCILLTYIFKKKEVIKNKWGLLINIPIIIISLSYLIYDNKIFNVLNVFIITLLYILMYIFTINPTYKIDKLITNIFTLIFEPFGKIGNIFRLLSSNKKKKVHNNVLLGKILKSLIIVIPILLFVIYLLSSADEIFGVFFKDIFEWIKNIKLENIIKELIGRGIIVIILFVYLSSVINYLLFNYKKINNESIPNQNIKVYDNFTLKVLFVSLNVIYVIFDIIQIRSLMLHQISMNITYAEYARRGFFELMIVSLLNLILILIAKKRENINGNFFSRTNSIMMIFLTLVIIASSFIRMSMYQNAYGATFLRLMVYVVLFTEIILLIPTIIYILNSKINIAAYYIIITISIYSALTLLPINKYIAKENVKRYYKTNKIDIDYLLNYSYDNIPELIELNNNTDEDFIKYKINNYFDSFDNKLSPQEYNIAKYRGIKLIKNYLKKS